MPAHDSLNDLLSSDPNEPATNGAVLLLRAEMKSEFRAIRSELGLVKQEGSDLKQDFFVAEQEPTAINNLIVGLKESLDGISRNLTILLNRR